MKKLVYHILLMDDKPDTLIYVLSMLNDLPFVSPSPRVISDIEEGYAYIRENEVDILLLDMDFGRADINGIKFFGLLHNPPVTVGCTSYSEYAFDRHEVGMDEYISKLISFKAFEKVMRRMADLVDAKVDRECREVDKLVLQDLTGKEIELGVKDICFAQVQNNITTVVMEHAQYSFKMSLKKFKSLLPANDFSRPHSSYLVALGKVTAITGRQVYLDSKQTNDPIPVSQELNKEFRHALELYRQKRK